jgi:amino acid adenylation domain-containing protein
MISKVKQNIETFSTNQAFVINETGVTYAQFGQLISNIRNLLRSIPYHKNEIIGIVTNNDIETYASIYALWFNGLCFVPINPLFPINRNRAIIEQTSIRFVLSSKDATEDIITSNEIQILSTKNLPDSPINLTLPELSDEDLMYILFTSGSTGVPKGVPINRGNVNGLVSGFFSIGYTLNENDKFLQMFDFTFDISVLCYVLPLCIGASVHTIPLDNIKFFAIYHILQKHQITVAMMVPSVIAFLRPYFNKIRLPDVKLSLFSGEALYDEIVAEWANCAPNAIIQNYYGPTEATVDCILFNWDKSTRKTKTYNGIVAIGKPFGDTKALILDDDGCVVSGFEKGELCISGNQVTTGYYKLPEKNESSFVTINGFRYYRTGDLVYRDNDGDLLFCGRIDHQVQIHGYRVELGELEHVSKQIAGNIQVAAIAYERALGNTEIHLFLESCSISIPEVAIYLQKVLPSYMQPIKIVNLETFPLTSSGKTNRNEFLNMIEKQQ